MRKILKRTSLASIAILVMISLVACGGSSSKKNPEDIIDAAIKSIKEIESVDMDFTMDLDMSVKMDESSIAMKMAMDMGILYDLESKDAYMSIDMEMKSLGEKESYDGEMYMIYGDDEYDTYTKVDGDWSHSTQEDDTVSNLAYGTDKSTLKDLKELENLKYDGEGKINKKDTYILTGEMGFEEFMKTNSALESSGAGFGDLSSMFEDMDEDGALPFSIQFFQETGEFAGLSVDAAEYMEEMMKNDSELSESMDGMKLSVDEFKYEILVNDYNEVDSKDLKLPKAAKNAASDDDDDYDEAYDYDEIEGVENPEGPWNTAKFTMDGKEYQLPLKVADLQADGYQFGNRADETLELEGQGSQYGIEFIKDGKTFTANLKNLTDDNIPIKDAVIINVSTSKGYGTEDTYMDIELPGGVKIGTTQEDLEKKYKEFSRKSNYTSSTYYNYEIDTEDGWISATVVVDNETKLVDSVEIENYK